MFAKIEPEILKKVFSLSATTDIDCVLFASDFHKLKNKLDIAYQPQYYPFINAFGVKLKMKNIIELAKLHEVKYITQNVKVNTCINVANEILSSKSVSKTPNFSTVVIDTGVYPHLDFLMPHKKIIEFVDLINGRKYPYDDNGHGTFVCGSLCGSGTISPYHRGIDPKTNLIVIKALDEKGETGSGTILSAMQWVFDNRKKYNIRLVCMSFGSVAIGKNDPLMLGAERLWDSGIVVVSAGGNSGPKSETIRSPGSSYKIITVGALDDHRKNGKPSYSEFSVAEFSSRGPIFSTFKPDVIASGVEVNGLNNNPSQPYTTMSGTSVSTPIVAGICSRLIKENPSFSPDKIKKRLISACTPITADRNVEGFGWLNGEKLFNSPQNRN